MRSKCHEFSEQHSGDVAGGRAANFFLILVKTLFTLEFNSGLNDGRSKSGTSCSHRNNSVSLAVCGEALSC